MKNAPTHYTSSDDRVELATSDYQYSVEKDLSQAETPLGY